MSSLGDRIQSLMDKKGLTAYRLAKDTGVSYTGITKIITGSSKKPQMESISVIADYLGVSLDYLRGQSIGAVVDDRLNELGLTMKELSEKTNIPLSKLETLDSVTPGPWDYEEDGVLDRLSKALEMDVRELSAAFARMEPPAYDGPRSSIEEDFAGVEFEGTAEPRRGTTRYTEEEILTMAAHQIGHEGDLTEEELMKIKLAMKIALNKDNN